MKKKTLITLLSLLVVLCIGAGILIYVTRPETSAGAKEIDIVVVHGDGSEKEFTYHTDEEYLGSVLLNEKLVEGETGEYGLFITSADGEEADPANQEWWCITKGGEQVNTGADTTPISSGDQFELTLTVGY